MNLLAPGRGVGLFFADRPYRLRSILAIVVVFGLAYGLMMGTYTGLAGRSLQLLYSAVKVPLMLLASFLIALPSFFVLNTLAGVRDDFGRVVKALLQCQAALVVTLASLGPFTLFWYVSHRGYQEAIVINGAMFAMATAGAQVVLQRLYAPLIASDPRHRILLRAWLVLYAFVGIQMGWVLRPFIGQPGSPVQFFRQSAWGNAYVEVWEIVRKAFE